MYPVFITDLPATAQNVVANQAITICCSAVGPNWERDFQICLDNGMWGSKSATADRMSHRAVFEAIQPGQLGIAVHGFHWQDPANPPRNANGAAYGPRAPEKVFGHACFTRFVLFEVDGRPYRSNRPVWSREAVDEWDLRLPFNPLHVAENVRLRMDEINPAVREGIRMSGIFASMPYVISPALVGMPGNGHDGGLLYPTTKATDAVAVSFVRVEASLLRKKLLGGRESAPCAFCGRESLDRDLHVTHLKQRAVCGETERLDPNVAVLGCVACHHGFDAGVFFVDTSGRMRMNPSAPTSEWRSAFFQPLEDRPFSAWSAPVQAYLSWHRTNVARQ
jgi:hypothetical protein